MQARFLFCRAKTARANGVSNTFEDLQLVFAAPDLGFILARSIASNKRATVEELITGNLLVPSKIYIFVFLSTPTFCLRARRMDLMRSGCAANVCRPVLYQNPDVKGLGIIRNHAGSRLGQNTRANGIC